jgi:hypothetical protein
MLERRPNFDRIQRLESNELRGNILQFQQVFIAELLVVKRIDSRYALKSVSRRNSQNIVDRLFCHLLTGIPAGRAFRANGVDFDIDDPRFP